MSNVESCPLNRIASLDAIRGIAALLVVTHHCYLTLPERLQQELDLLNSPARLLVVGRPAVILFFVLSGFVLSRSLVGRARLPYWAFVVRRVFRIYVPFAVAVLVSAALYALVEPRQIPELSGWFNKWIWSDAPTVPLLLAHLAMTGRPGDVTLNNPVWSLIIEMRISLLFPMLFALFWPRRTLLFVAAIASAVLAEVIARGTSLGRLPYFNDSVLQAALLTLYFIPYFVAGILIAQRCDQLSALLDRVASWMRVVLWLAALMLLSTGRDLLAGFGASLVIVLTLSGPQVRKFLSTAVLQWLGRISYSLYLVHVLVLGALVNLLYGDIPLGWILLAVMPVSAAAAQISYSIVERPAMALGKYMTRRPPEIFSAEVPPVRTGEPARQSSPVARPR